MYSAFDSTGTPEWQTFKVARTHVLAVLLQSLADILHMFNLQEGSARRPSRLAHGKMDSIDAIFDPAI